MFYLSGHQHNAETLRTTENVRARVSSAVYFSLDLMRVGLIMGLLLLGGCSRAQFVSARSVIFPPESGPKVVWSCNTGIPSDITGYWMPSAADVEQMEALLPDFLLHSPIGRNFSDYQRQYVGVIVNGRKLVFVSALVPFSRWHLHWKIEPIRVCGGGSDCWRVALDPQTKQFSHWEVNGPY